MSNILLDALKEQPLICAEGYLFEMERRGYLTSGEFVPEVALEHPEVLENLHKEFQHAGLHVEILYEDFLKLQDALVLLQEQTHQKLNNLFVPFQINNLQHKLKAVLLKHLIKYYSFSLHLNRREMKSNEGV